MELPKKSFGIAALCAGLIAKKIRLLRLIDQREGEGPMAANNEQYVEEVQKTIDAYLRAVREKDITGLRSLFDGSANVAHYHFRKDTVVTNTLDEFMGVIESLHAKFDNAEEVAENVNVRIVGHLASVELDFCFIMGPNKMRGTDLFNLAHRGEKWVIVHKSYWL